MNRTLIFITFALLVAIAIVGSLITVLIAPSRLESFVGFMVVLLGLAATFAVNASQLEKNKQEMRNLKTETSTKLDVVQRQTNGTLSTLTERLEEKNQIITLKDRRIHDLESALLKATERKYDE